MEMQLVFEDEDGWKKTLPLRSTTDFLFWIFFLRQPWGMNQPDFTPLTPLSTSRPAWQLSHLAAYKLLLPCVSRVLPSRPHIILFKPVSPAASPVFLPRELRRVRPEGAARSAADSRPCQLMTLGRLPAGSHRRRLPSGVAGLNQQRGRSGWGSRTLAELPLQGKQRK